MLFYLENLESFWGPLRLFHFITIRSGMAFVAAFFIGLLCGPRLFILLQGLKLGQPLRSAAQVGKLSELHKEKAGTPTMGGLLIYLSVMISGLLFARLNVYTIVAFFIYTALTVLGFLDDYLKIKRKSSHGVAGRFKLIWQAATAIIALTILLSNKDSHSLMLELWVPFMKQPLLSSMGMGLALLLFFLIIAGSSNAINLTDGVDGLAIGCTVSAASVFAIIAYAVGHAGIAEYLYLRHILGAGELAIICASLVGASLAFLWYNAHPAEVFMGDTGSLALGGLIGSIAFMVQQPFTLIIVGGIFVIEALSVILQVASFKFFGGKRIFRIAPIHHHFEMKGWKEPKIVVRFWILALLFAIAGLATLKLR